MKPNPIDTALDAATEILKSLCDRPPFDIDEIHPDERPATARRRLDTAAKLARTRGETAEQYTRRMRLTEALERIERAMVAMLAEREALEAIDNAEHAASMGNAKIATQCLAEASGAMLTIAGNPDVVDALTRLQSRCARVREALDARERGAPHPPLPALQITRLVVAVKPLLDRSFKLIERGQSGDPLEDVRWPTRLDVEPIAVGVNAASFHFLHDANRVEAHVLAVESEIGNDALCAEVLRDTLDEARQRLAVIRAFATRGIEFLRDQIAERGATPDDLAGFDAYVAGV